MRGSFRTCPVDQWDGLLADYMRNTDEDVLIRGVRSNAEFEHEYTTAVINRMLNDQFETFLIPSDPKLSAVSSSAVREILAFGGEIKGLVPDTCLKDIREILSKKK